MLFFVSSVVLVRDILCDTSRILESLSEVAGVQSFLLAVDPSAPSDGGFLGGSVVGREFWRGLRGGGEGGARALKAHSINHIQRQPASRSTVHISKPSSPPPKARSLKNELYESVRNALRYALIFSHVHTFKVSFFPIRSASGVRSAEMKWTNPERLDAYGVRLIGWPEGVPAQNPSSFKVSQNKILLEALQNGSMRFERINPIPPMQEEAEASKPEEECPDPHEDFSWAYDADASPPPSSHAEYPPPLPPRQPLNTGQTPVLPVIIDEAESSWASTLETDSTLSQYTLNFLWAGDFNEPTTELAWDDESDADLRPRKRSRSAEP
jgi:hypothetical protein